MRLTAKCSVAKINDCSTFIIDSGADVSIFRHNAINPDANIHKESINLNGIALTTLKTLGSVEAIITIKGESFPHTFHVVGDDFSITDDAILGADFLRRYNAQLNFESGELNLKHQTPQHLAVFTCPDWFTEFYNLLKNENGTISHCAANVVSLIDHEPIKSRLRKANQFACIQELIREFLVWKARTKVDENDAFINFIKEVDKHSSLPMNDSIPRVFSSRTSFTTECQNCLFMTTERNLHDTLFVEKISGQISKDIEFMFAEKTTSDANCINCGYTSSFVKTTVDIEPTVLRICTASSC